jgi:predicted permease
MLLSLRSDLLFALRQLRKSPGFAVTAILTLALGIGTTTAIYTLVDGILLKPLPLPHPEQLVAVYTQYAQPGQSPWNGDTSYPNYLDWRERTRSFSQLAAWHGDNRLVSRANGLDGDVLPICRVTGNYFKVLGVQPFLGRDFTLDDDQPGHHVAILRYSFWQHLYAGNRNVLGATILVSDVPYTIIGVMPKDLIEPRNEDQAELWTSFATLLDGSAPPGRQRDNGVANIMGRLKPGITLQQAHADLSTIQASLAKAYVEDHFSSSVFIQSQQHDLTGDSRPTLLLLLAAVLSLLLIVCTNASGLLLTRTLNRRGEIALRVALGSSPRRIGQQLLIEAMILALAGGVVGAALAYLALHATLPLIPDDVPRLGEVALDGRVLAFTALLSVLCAVVSSLAPAWKLTHVSPLEALREQSQSTTGRRSHYSHNALVIAQTALSFALLFASGLLIHGFINVRNARTGFRPDHLFRAQLPLTNARYPDAKKVFFYKEFLEKLAAIPGVRSASGGSPIPLSGSYHSAPVEIDGRPNPPDVDLTARVGEAEPGCFETLGVPLLAGRTITEADNDLKAPFVALVNQAFVRRYFPSVNPIGHHIRLDLSQQRNQSNDVDPTSANSREIIGVLADFQQNSVMEPPLPMAVLPYAQASMLMRPLIVLRVAGDPFQYIKPVQAALSSIDRTLFLLNPGSLDYGLKQQSAGQRFETLIVTAFASIALFLCALGLYATLAGMVATRTREIGLRIAIGANRRDVASLILLRAAALVLAGLTLGSALAIAAARSLAAAWWARPLLFGVTWFDPRTWSLILLVLVGASLIACLIPVRRALAVDPIRVLRDQ